MSLDLYNLAWHRSAGTLIMQLNRPAFWSSLVRVLKEYVQIDNWVVLIFSDQQVRVISLTEVADADEVDALTQRYVRSEEHTSELQSRLHLVCRLLLEKKKNRKS